jgi:hypothetical protein
VNGTRREQEETAEQDRCDRARKVVEILRAAGVKSAARVDGYALIIGLAEAEILAGLLSADD